MLPKRPTSATVGKPPAASTERRYSSSVNEGTTIRKSTTTVRATTATTSSGSAQPLLAASSSWTPPGETSAAPTKDLEKPKLFELMSRRKREVINYRSYQVTPKSAQEIASEREEKDAPKEENVPLTPLRPTSATSKSASIGNVSAPAVNSTGETKQHGAAVPTKQLNTEGASRTQPVALEKEVDSVKPSGVLKPSSSTHLLKREMEPKNSGAYVDHFPSVGHYCCSRCGTPMFCSSSKGRSFGGYCCFSSYFAPSITLDLVLPQTKHSLTQGCSTVFHGLCGTCKNFVGYVPLEMSGDEHGVGQHLMRVNSTALRYVGMRAPPEFKQLEAPVLDGSDEDDGTARKRKPSIGGGGTASLRKGQYRANAHHTAMPTAKQSQQLATRRRDDRISSSDDEDSSDDIDSADEDNEDDAMWATLRSSMKCR